jgi:hypothetical protein
LWQAEYLHEIADTYNLVAHEVEQSKAGAVGESQEEAFHFRS